MAPDLLLRGPGASLREGDQNRRLNAAGLRSDLCPDRSANLERSLAINRATNDRPDLVISVLRLRRSVDDRIQQKSDR